MTLEAIRLPTGPWVFDTSKPLGRAGGFGEVLLGQGNGRQVAIKRLKRTADDAAYRELKIADDLSGRTLKQAFPAAEPISAPPGSGD
jgi:hypothetical protein